MTTINLEDLTAEVSPEEVEEAESGIESKEVDQQHSPFAHLMSNLLQGGGKRRKQGYRGKWSIGMFESCAGFGEIMGPKSLTPSDSYQAGKSLGNKQFEKASATDADFD